VSRTSIVGVQPQRATGWEREYAARLGLHVATSQDPAADPAGAAATALGRLPAGPLAVHIDADVLDFTGTPLAQDTGGRNTAPTLGQAEQAHILAARDPRARVLPIGELNPARSAGDPDALPRSADSIARILAVTGRG
jgi:arginase